MTTETSENVRILTRKLKSALRTHVKPALEQLNDARNGRSEEPLAMLDDLERLAISLDSAAMAFEQADQTVTRETNDDTLARRARDIERLELRTQLISLAQGVDSLYGRDTVVALRLSGGTPSRADALITYAQKFSLAVSKLETLPSPRVAWNTIDLTAAAATISAQAELLQTRVDTVDTDVRETEIARSTRDVALDHWQDEARFITTLCRAVLLRNHQPDLAARVVPSQRQVDRIDRSDTLDDDTPTGDTPASPQTDDT
ncbi:MAG: hypothetical protein AAFS10_17690 [Myxococcota bacterium]